MKIKNPLYVHPVVAKIAARKGAIQAFLAAQNTDTIDFATIRAALPLAERAEWSDGMIQQLAQDLGLVVIE